MLKVIGTEPDTPPPIAPLRDATARPRFSVMLPTHEPDEKLLVSLRSVLAQAPPRDRMQIAIVDDASRPGRLRDLVRSVDPHDRIEIFEFRDRLGLAGNWNRAIELARGHLVHLLHQDDYVRPTFYARIEQGFLGPVRIGMAFTRSLIVDGDDRLIKTSSRLRWLPGVLADWLPLIAERQRIQTPAAVVARSVYEEVGGYRPDLCQTLDWEMWVRIAAHAPVWYEPRSLAVYRRHSGNESARLRSTGEVWPDLTRAIEINARSLPEAIRDRVTAASARWYAASALRTVERLLAEGAVDQAAATLGQIPGMLRLLGPTSHQQPVHRRLATLRLQVGTRAARAA